MEEFELVALAGGIYSLRSRANGQTFHPVVGPVAEANAVHVGGTRLVERANETANPPSSGRRFVIWDVGLGAAANALAAIRALVAGYRREEDVELWSFDQTVAPLEFALANREALEYPLAYAATLDELLETGEARIPTGGGAGSILWRLTLGDFSAFASRPLGTDVAAPAVREPAAPNAIFFDPYSPTANREMWSLELFAALHARTRCDAPCLLSNYTRSTAVRVTLLLAGFFVGIGPATGEKDETTLAANDLALLERPMTREWLDKKVYASTNAAPLRAGAVCARGPIGEEDFALLREHPQFR